MTKYYVDGKGNYLGGFDGVPPPDGGIEVTEAPDDARQKWSNGSWQSLTQADIEEYKKEIVDRMFDDPKTQTILEIFFDIQSNNIPLPADVETLKQNIKDGHIAKGRV